jgi:hypothetical protein
VYTIFVLISETLQKLPRRATLPFVPPGGDNGASDTFSISIDASYQASGTLKSGNINIHEK